MKRNEKENRNRSLLVVLVVALMFAITLVGCKKKENIPEPSTSTSEVATSEPISEEPSEVTSEPVSEEPSEVVPEEIDLTLYTVENGKNLLDLTNDMTYNELKLIVWKYEYGAKAIVSDGDSYVMEDDDDLLFLYYPKKVQSIKDNMEGAVHILVEDEKYCGFNLYAIGKDLEVTFTVVYEDGSEEEITMLLTKEFE